MNINEMEKWFEDTVLVLEKKYILHQEPWRQSGFSGPEERWVACRKPIANCMHISGSFLDVGCANGYLLESVVKWKQEQGIEIIPYGLDIGEELVKLAKERLPRYSENIFIGNALQWVPALKFNFVRIEIVYVPEKCRVGFLKRILSDFLKPQGKLLVCEYRSSKIKYTSIWIDELLKEMGFEVQGYESGYYDGKELTRVAILE